MEHYKIDINQCATGRAFEVEALQGVASSAGAALVIVYGRRRIGKTELIEQAYRTRNILKFEGIHNQTQQQQIQNVLWQLSEYTAKPYLANLNLSSWKQVFKLINEYIAEEICTLYFEEVQWLADYQDDFIADLKYVWDNFFKRKKNLVLVLCGSSPSFFINRVIKSKALYNRSQIELPLKELSLNDTKNLLKKFSNRDVMDAYLMVGGIPEYLNWLKSDSSVFLSFCNHAFRPGGYFVSEYEKIFISGFAEKAHYKEIIDYLAKRRFATRKEILKTLKLTSSGTISAVLEDLEICGFIEKYAPYNLNADGRLVRYCIRDNYLQMYYKFIHPIRHAILQGDFVENPSRAINQNSLHKWLGFAFERFCRRQHKQIAKILGFGAVRYKSGVYFSKGLIADEPGFQFDLIFERADNVLTLCEVRYLRKKVGSNVIAEMETKIEKMNLSAKKTIQLVLISNEGPDDALIQRHYFDQIITLEDFFG